MPLNPDIRDRAYQFFIEEARELLQVLERGLLDLRQDHSTPKIHELMRAAHSIKGGAASVELSAIELLAHRLEDFLKALYSDEVEFDAKLENLLLEGYDCLANPLTEQIEAGTFDAEAALLTAEPVFAALEERLADALENADNYIPSANDLGVDIVASIFEVDVAQALEHLKEVENNPTDYDPVAELQAQLEMFAGFAELFNLAGFSEIVQSAQTALAQNSHRTLEIIHATIADCTVAKDRVLAGDRQQGGEVSPALRELAGVKATESIGNNAPTSSFDELTLDEDNIWSDVSATEPLAEDIFSTIPNGEINHTEDSTLDEENIWSDASATESLAEDIFSTIPDEILAQTETAVEDIGQLFEMISPENAAETTLSEEITSPDNLGSFTDIDEVFGIIPDEQDLDDVNRVFEEIPPAEMTTEVIDTPADEIATTEDEPSAPENLTAAIESIEDIFDRLPSVAQEFALSPTEKSEPQPQPVPTKSAEKVKATPKLSVRVDLDRLERMNNLIGELTINRNSLALQNDRLQESVSELGQKFLRFRGVTKKLREISNRMLLEQPASGWRSLTPPIATSPLSYLSSDSASETTEFDVLEMDSYNSLYDSLQEVLEEIVQLEESVDDITIFAQQSNSTIANQRQMLGQMRGELMWVRMLPLDQIMQRFPRTIRELSNKYHKPVELKLNGTGVLVDKAVLEKLSDPLLHLLRNGFDHGIEEPELRTQQGKPATGSIEIQAYYQGNQTVIEVKDDGKGLDLAKIGQKGIERGLISEREASAASPERLFELIFEPGFSTASEVSEISGRGVGMNIVRSQVEALKGKISVTSTPGKGSTFTLRLPLTLTIAKLLVCSLGATAFAIPSDSIEEIIIPTPEQIKLANEQKFLFLNRKLVPIYVLREYLQYNCRIVDADSTSKAFKTIAPPEDWLAPLLTIRRGQQLFALEIVSLLSEQELVIKPYGRAIAAPAYSYGCTILSDGSLIPVFDSSALISTILGEEVRPIVSSNVSPIIRDTGAAIADELNDDRTRESFTDNNSISFKTIMVVDDSTTLRRTMALTLEKEGYRVVQKKDGKEALNGFKQNPDLDLIICDVEMPVMNGFEFLGMRRRDSALSQVPTFMLTSRSGTKHRNLAMQLGADGYFTKPYIEQEFVEEVKKILSVNSKSNENAPSAIAVKTETVLIIDDSSALRRTLALNLENKGYRVLQGRDGREGLQLLRDNLPIDLVICDVEMPNMNGFEFLAARRQEPQLARIPVVMLTSRNSQKHRTLASNLGAAGFFTKPYVEERFIRDIEQYLDRR